MLLIGLTGNYGMGKSTVLSMFRKCGAYTLGADEIVRELLEKPYVKKKIKKIFGNDFFCPNDRINKEKIAAAIFSDSSLRTELENILHPLVLKKISAEIKKAQKEYSIAIIEIPLLFEKNYENIFDKTITVFTTKKEAIRRLEKKGINKTDAIMRLKTQLPVKEKIRKSDFTIDNSKTPELTKKAVEKLYENLLKEATHGNN
ncbi:MAG: dephospho-CoA kinase [Nitrospirae bacterium]|jgi:dephospho-CoA kinase|nr:dephospho-CoA kinase [Nitrospirota bacterium]